MEIRAARDADIPAIAAITNYYIVTTTIHFAYEPIANEEFLAHLHHDVRFPWLVAVGDGGDVVGYAKSDVWRGRRAYHWTTEVALYIAPDVRRRGIGRALYAELFAELERRGFRSAIAGIALPNDPSIALHRAFGFVSVGVVRDAGWKHDAWCDVEFFQKRFATEPVMPAGAP